MNFYLYILDPVWCRKRRKIEKEIKRERERHREREHAAKHLFDCYLGAIVSNYWLEHLKKLITGRRRLASRQTWSQVPLSCLPAIPAPTDATQPATHSTSSHLTGGVWREVFGKKKKEIKKENFQPIRPPRY